MIHHASAVRTAVSALVALVVATGALAATPPSPAAALATPIDPVLQQQMQVSPQKMLPVIVEMEHPAGLVAGLNAQLAQQALGLLRINGQAQAALPLLDSAAGLANAAGIVALSI